NGASDFLREAREGHVCRCTYRTPDLQIWDGLRIPGTASIRYHPRLDMRPPVDPVQEQSRAHRKYRQVFRSASTRPTTYPRLTCRFRYSRRSQWSFRRTPDALRETRDIL